MAETVTAPIEQEINGVHNMLYQASQSVRDGRLTITVMFNQGTDSMRRRCLCKNRVAIATPRLPPEVQRLGIATKKTSPDFLLGPPISWIVNPATARARIAGAEADNRAALATFDGIVLTALVEAETALSHYARP